MKDNDKIEELYLIERHLQGKLSLAEEEVFNKKLAADDDFREDVHKTKQLYKDLEDLRAQKMMLKALDKVNAEEHSTIVGIPIKIIKQSISLGLAACLIMSMFLINSPVNLPDTENDINVLREIDTTAFTPENRIVYKTFFDGQAHFVSGEYLLASMDFEKVLTINDLREYFKEAAQWHLVLSYYKSNQPNKAEKLYKSLSDCDDCEYQVAWLDKWKIWCQIQWQKVRG